MEKAKIQQFHMKNFDMLISIIVLTVLTGVIFAYPSVNTEFINRKASTKVCNPYQCLDALVPGHEFDDAPSIYNDGDVAVCLFVKVDIPHAVVIPQENMDGKSISYAPQDYALFDYSYADENGKTEYNTDKWTDITSSVYGEDYEGFSHWFAYTRGNSDEMISLRPGEDTGYIYNKVKVTDFNWYEEELEVFQIGIETHFIESSLAVGKSPDEAWATFVKDE